MYVILMEVVYAYKSYTYTYDRNFASLFISCYFRPKCKSILRVLRYVKRTELPVTALCFQVQPHVVLVELPVNAQIKKLAALNYETLRHFVLLTL